MVKVFNQSFVKLVRSRAEELIDSGERGSVTRPALAEAVAGETDQDVATIKGAIDACLAGKLLKGLSTRRGRKGGIIREVLEAEEPEATETAETAPEPTTEPETVEAASTEPTDCAEAIEAAAQEAEVDERPAEGCEEPTPAE